MKRVAGLIFALSILSSAPLWSDDTDIYGGSTVSVTPNVLVILRHSGSIAP